jgi:hypothetical protein
MNSGDVGRGVAGIWRDYLDAYAFFGGSQGIGTYAYFGKNDVHHIPTGLPAGGNMRIYWNGDLWQEHLDGFTATSFTTGVGQTTLRPTGVASNNGSKNNPMLVADLFGDWREELVVRTADNTAVRIYTTTYPTEYRYYTFMHDPLYRVGVSFQNSTYNQPQHISFYLADRDGYRDLQPKAHIKRVTG